MLALIAVPTSPIDAVLRLLAQLTCTISAGGEGCAVIQ